GVGRQDLQDGLGQRRLARPGFPHDGQGLALVQGKAHVGDHRRIAARRVEADVDVLHVQQWFGRGHSWAPWRVSEPRRIASPSTFMLSTVRNMNSEGNMLMCGAVSSMELPSAIRVPQVGRGGGTLTPMKLSAPSATMMTDMMVSA